MSYSWQLAAFPVTAGEEVTWKHFETLRRRIYAMRFLQAGMPTYNYAAPITTSTWEAWVDANFTDLDFVHSLNYENSAWTRLLNIVYQSTTGMAEPDLFSHCDPGSGYANKAALKADPPCSAAGVISANWCYAADVSRYRDFDRYAGRYIVKRYTAGTGVSYLSKSEAFRYLPIQVGPQHQRPHIHYTDTGRRIPHITPLERNWQFVSQPTTMGPNFDIIGETVVGNFRLTKEPFDGDDARSIPLNGYEYAITLPDADPAQGGGASADDVLPDQWVADDQQYFDPKFCDAYQNQVEHLMSTFSWMLRIDPETAWGAEWIYHYNQTLYHLVPEWPNYIEDFPGYNYKTRYDGGVWSKPGGTLNEPTRANGWSRVDYGNDHTSAEPTIVSAEDEYWGCNRSAFELALRILGSYDWYFLADHKFSPRELLHVREDLRNSGGYPIDPTEEDIQTWYPLSAGTWRRTWRYTFGRPKWAASMMPGTSTPDGELYIDHQGEGAGGYFWWPGIFIPAGYAPGYESEYLTESEIEELYQRHDSVCTEPRTKYEMTAKMLNDMWAVMELMSLAFVPASLAVEIRQGDGTVSGKVSSTAAYEDALAAAVSDVAGKSFATPPSPTVGEIGKTVSVSATGSPATWSGTAAVLECRLSIAPENLGGTIEKLMGQTLYAIVQIKPFYNANIYEDPTPPYEKGIGIYDSLVFISGGLGETLEVPNWDLTYASANRPSTGVPDGWPYNEPPDNWIYWGGLYDQMIISGRIAVIPVVLDELTWDSGSNAWKIPVLVTSSVPETIGSYAADKFIEAFGRAYVTVIGDLGGLAVTLDLEDDRIDWETFRHTSYTVIDEDDEKFDVNGLLL